MLEHTCVVLHLHVKQQYIKKEGTLDVIQAKKENGRDSRKSKVNIEININHNNTVERRGITGNVTCYIAA